MNDLDTMRLILIHQGLDDGMKIVENLKELKTFGDLKKFRELLYSLEHTIDLTIAMYEDNGLLDNEVIF